MAQATGQAPRERTLAEIKTEVMRRAGKLSPFESIKAADAERILGSVNSLDRDEWAAAWVAVGMEYEKSADALAAKAGKGAELAESYSLAFDYCRLGRYPAATTSGTKEAYRHSIRCFRKAAQHFEQPLQVVELPFQGKTLTGYLQVPQGAARPAVVMHWGGVDGWKEDRQRQNKMLNGLGLATLTIDMPGTGESPISYRDPNAEASYIAWLDHLAQRSDVDGSRVGVWGGSFGAYWAARLAHVVPDRIKGAVFHGGNVHVGFQRDWLVPAFTTGGATYLFGPSSLLEARGSAMGTKTMEDFLEVAPSFSLIALGLIDKPSAPILGINGKLDDQAPIADVYLLMEHGSPKCARVYPQGHHMGRTPGMPEDEITRTITTWLAGQLAAN